MSNTNNVFEKHPALKAYHETADGVKFAAKNDAENHAKRLKNRSIKTVTRDQVPAPKKKEKPKADNPVKGYANLDYEKRADYVAHLDSVQEIDKLIADETSKTVKEAGAKRIAEINASDQLNEGETENNNVTDK